MKCSILLLAVIMAVTFGQTWMTMEEAIMSSCSSNVACIQSSPPPVDGPQFAYMTNTNGTINTKESKIL